MIMRAGLGEPPLPVNHQNSAIKYLVTNLEVFVNINPRELSPNDVSRVTAFMLTEEYTTKLKVEVKKFIEEEYKTYEEARTFHTKMFNEIVNARNTKLYHYQSLRIQYKRNGSSHKGLIKSLSLIMSNFFSKSYITSIYKQNH